MAAPRQCPSVSSRPHEKALQNEKFAGFAAIRKATVERFLDYDWKCFIFIDTFRET